MIELRSRYRDTSSRHRNRPYFNQLRSAGKALKDIGLNDGMGAYFGKQFIEHAGRASANALLLGTPLDKALEGALVSSLLSTGTAFGADAIGDLGVPDGNGGVTLNAAGRHMLHALLGCASGAVQAGREGCAAGGTGALLGELAAAWFNPDGTRSQAETLAFAQLIAGLGGALATGSAEGVAIGATAGGNAAEHNYLNHLERVTLNQADKACKTSGQQCDTAAALKYKDELSDRLLANAVAACEGEACNDTVNFINQQLVAVGCTAPQVCPDQTTLLAYWNVAQQKAQGLQGVYPETWLLDAKAALDLGKLGIRVLAGSGKGSLDALNALSKASADDLVKINNNALRDDWQQFDQFRKPDSTRPGGEWDWQGQAPNNGAVPGTEVRLTVQPGERLDRFGGPNGTYLSPAEVPYHARALPPGSRADGYHTYTVQKPFLVEKATVSEAFGQPGGGVQYRVITPDGVSVRVNVDYLLKNGYLK